MVQASPQQPFDRIPDEVLVRILILIPTRERLVLEEVNQRFKRIVRWMLTSSEEMFRLKFIHMKEESARKSLLRYSNLRLLNMDLASALFARMNEKERSSFAWQMSVSCPRIQTVYLSHRFCFEIVALYCQHMGVTLIHTIRAVVLEDRHSHITLSHLRTIRNKSPRLNSQWIIMCPIACDEQDEQMDADSDFPDKHESDFEVHDARIMAAC